MLGPLGQDANAGNRYGAKKACWSAPERSGALQSAPGAGSWRLTADLIISSAADRHASLANGRACVAREREGSAYPHSCPSRRNLGDARESRSAASVRACGALGCHGALLSSRGAARALACAAHTSPATVRNIQAVDVERGGSLVTRESTHRAPWGAASGPPGDGEIRSSALEVGASRDRSRRSVDHHRLDAAETGEVSAHAPVSGGTGCLASALLLAIGARAGPELAESKSVAAKSRIASARTSFARVHALASDALSLPFRPVEPFGDAESVIGRVLVTLSDGQGRLGPARARSIAVPVGFSTARVRSSGAETTRSRAHARVTSARTAAELVPTLMQVALTKNVSGHGLVVTARASVTGARTTKGSGRTTSFVAPTSPSGSSGALGVAHGSSWSVREVSCGCRASESGTDVSVVTVLDEGGSGEWEGVDSLGVTFHSLAHLEALAISVQMTASTGVLPSATRTMKTGTHPAQRSQCRGYASLARRARGDLRSPRGSARRLGGAIGILQVTRMTWNVTPAPEALKSRS
jgi:hypothetical protein